jgi:predicted site-specific integrase-resolvase
MPAKRTSEKTKTKQVFGQSRKPAKMLRAALYARVSTLDQQTLPMQMRALRDYATSRGWTVAMQVKEVGSGAAQRQATSTTDRCCAAARDRCCAGLAA